MQGRRKGAVVLGQVLRIALVFGSGRARGALNVGAQCCLRLVGRGPFRLEPAQHLKRVLLALLALVEPEFCVERGSGHRLGDALALNLVEGSVKGLGSVHRALDGVLQSLGRVGLQIVGAKLLVALRVTTLDVLYLLRAQAEHQFRSGNDDLINGNVDPATRVVPPIADSLGRR